MAFDNDPEALDWIDRGAITATITQKPCVMSYDGLKFLDDLHHNAVHQFEDWRTALAAPMPTFVDTGTVVVDKSNLKLYREALSAHPKPLKKFCMEMASPVVALANEARRDLVIDSDGIR